MGVRGQVLSVAFAATFFLAVSAPGAAALDRATSDRPDALAGPQVHVLYVLPSDSPDEALDTNGTIEKSVDAWNGWLRGQTGGNGLRLDLFDGQLDTSFVRLAETNDSLSTQQSPWPTIDQELASRGFAGGEKTYAVYYGGGWNLCGAGIFRYPVAVLHGVDSRTGIACPAGTLGQDPPGWLDFSMLHEIIHSFGYVQPCAPHHTSTSHVGDSSFDLMWGDSPWSDLSQMQLDVNHDDYYLARIPGCPDLSGSRYLEGVASGRLDVTTVNEGGASGGTIVDSTIGGSSPLAETGEFDCVGATCTRYYDTWPIGSIQLSATETADHEEFVSWSGACSGTDPDCTITLDQTKSVTATFKKDPPPLVSIKISGHGRVVSKPAGISCSPACSAQFGFESDLELQAKPARGWRFAGWTNALGLCGKAARCRLIIDDAEAFRAGFVKQTIPVRVSVSGRGQVFGSPKGLSCPRRCSASFAYGTMLVVRASARPGWRFAGWSGSCRGARRCSLQLTGSLTARRVHAAFRRR
jgi:hypothetical protein